jgi:hypothetical protein
MILVCALCFLQSGCGNKKVTKENLDQLKNGMSLEDVQDILGKSGQPQGDGSMVAAQVGVDVTGGSGGSSSQEYLWENGAKKIFVRISNSGKVVGIRREGF